LISRGSSARVCPYSGTRKSGASPNPPSPCCSSRMMPDSRHNDRVDERSGSFLGLIPLVTRHHYLLSALNVNPDSVFGRPGQTQ